MTKLPEGAGRRSPRPRHARPHLNTLAATAVAQPKGEMRNCRVCNGPRWHIRLPDYTWVCDTCGATYH